MKNVSSIKTKTKNESPKTPGGISKSLLTPCRRVGLSRNWKNKGPAPFISPLASNPCTKVEVVELKKESRKRKSVVEPDEKSNGNVIETTKDGDIATHSTNTGDIVKTPLRNVDLPLRKKSKTFLATLNSQASTNVENSTVSPKIDDCTEENETNNDLVDKGIDIEIPNTGKVSKVPDVSSLKTKAVQNNKKFQSPLKTPTKITLRGENTAISVEDIVKETPKEVTKPMEQKSELKTSKTKSPNELTKECIVVIQKKLLKVKEQYEKCDKDVSEPKKNSQPLFDSDDETPLSKLNKKENTKVSQPTTTLDDEDDEFMETSKNKTKKIVSKKTTKIDNKAKPPKIIPETESKAPSQSSFDDDDDFFDKKKTILIRKTYDKVSKPHKAKSTGSITQKDIDNLKARIDVKKKMLLARSMTAETEELRGLIKKWQKGCQEALVELMDLMRLKCPDKHDMDYSEILQMLKIPASLVGYDSDHDCFNTPDDSSAVLSKYNDF